jgi:hypothetical protein
MRPLLVFALYLSFGLSGCDRSKPECAAPATPGLEGTWKLVERQCYCPRSTPTPNETLTLTATAYSIYTNGQLSENGTYISQAVTLCGSPGPALGLRFTHTTLNIGPRDAMPTLKGDTLVLDYGSPCDAPRDTYQRVVP